MPRANAGLRAFDACMDACFSEKLLALGLYGASGEAALERCITAAQDVWRNLGIGHSE